MGSIIGDLWGDGFTYRDDSGKKVHYRRSMFGTGYVGSDGSRLDEHILDRGYTLKDSRGKKIESFMPNLFFEGYTGDRGTSVDPNIFAPGSTVRKKKK